MVLSEPVGGGGVLVIVMFTVLAALAPAMTFWRIAPLADSTPLLFTARMVKYHVPWPSEPIEVEVARGSLMALVLVSAVELVPYSTLKLARAVGVVPSLFWVGAGELWVDGPARQVSR